MRNAKRGTGDKGQAHTLPDGRTVIQRQPPICSNTLEIWPNALHTDAECDSQSRAGVINHNFNTEKLFGQ